MTCANTCNAGALVAPNNPNTPYMQRVAQGVYQYPEFDPEVRKWTQSNLYETLKEKPSLINGNVVLSNFMQGKDSTTANLLYQTKAQIKNADTLSINDKTVRETHKVATDSLLVSIKNIDIALSQNSADTAILYAQKRAYITDLSVQNQSYSNYLLTYKQQRSIKLTNAEAYNNAAEPTAAVFEQNEKIINEIYLSTIAKGIYIFTDAQQVLIDAIANACPLVSGPCTFRARSLRRLYTPDAMYNDVALCHQVGISYRIKPKTESAISKSTYKVYPNPANDILHLECSNTTNPSVVCIIDILGRIIFSDKINSFNSTIDISTISTGLYYVQIKANEFEVFTTKLSIIK